MATNPPRSPLHTLLRSRGTKQVWLAIETGIDASDISRFVNGLAPGRERAHLIARALGVTCTDLGWPEHDQAEAA